MGKKKVRQAAKRRGGRRPGSWTLLTPESLRTWRGASGMSRAALASMLEVSSTSVQNWETGNAVATTKMQQRLAELMKAPLAAASHGGKSTTNPAPARKIAPAADEAGGSLVQATAAIIVEAIKAGGKRAIVPKELSLLIRTVRDALS